MALDLKSYLLGKKGSGGSKGLKVEVVQELPTTGEDNVLYLVPKTTTGTNNVFEEYLYINNNWELIGTTDIDLSGYQTIDNLVTSIDAQSTDSQYPSAKLLYDLFSSFGNFKQVNSNYNDAFIFDGKKGCYVFNQDNELYYKFKANDGTLGGTKQLYNYYVVAIIIPNDYNIPKSGSFTIQCKMILLSTSEGLVIASSFFSWGYDSSATISSTRKYMTLSTQPQTISGIKTFSSIPLQSTTTAPTQDAQFTNKKYVDDSIANAIGTALGGSY